MSSPKDPEKLAQYREKMRQIALERGFGKWMQDRKLPPESIEKMRQKQRERGNDPEERKRHSERAKANGTGKWIAGRPANPGFVEHARSRKGKSYEEIYGEDRAAQERENRKLGNKQAKAGKRPPHLMELQKEIARKRKGKTNQEIFGENAEEELSKRQIALRKRGVAKPRKADRRPKHNGDHRYTDWRKAVFVRDDYICQRCSQRGGALQAHHIQPWSKHPDLRYEVANGLTLCKPCHEMITSEQRLAEKKGKKQVEQNEDN